MVDWTKPIVIAATDWQGELPARVKRKTARRSYWVRITAPHRIHREGVLWDEFDWEFNPDGTCIGFPAIRVINKETGDE